MEGRSGLKAYFASWTRMLSRTATSSTPFNAYGYFDAELLVQILRQCGDDLTRRHVMRQRPV